MTNRLLATALAAPSAIATTTVLAQPGDGRPGNWHYGWEGGWGFGHMVFGSLMMILFWGGLILLIVLAVRYFGQGSTGGSERPAGGGTALRILEERFARGEIDKAEFEERKRALSG